MKSNSKASSSNIISVLVGLALTSLNAGCTGYSAGSPVLSPSTPPPPAIEREVGSEITAMFVDAPVVGLNYAATHASGITTDGGKFPCKLGETVTFSIGSMQLGSAPCGQAIFPMHLTGELFVNPDGGSVALGVLLKALDTDSTDDVYTIPTAVRTMDFSSTVDFSTFDASIDLAAFKATLDEINTDAGLSINSANIETNYAATFAPSAVTELEGSITNPDYVSLPSNITSYDEKSFFLTGTLSAGSDGTCSSAAATHNFGVSLFSDTAGSGKAYFVFVHPVISDRFDPAESIGTSILTGTTLSMSSQQTVNGDPETSQLVLNFNSGSVAGLTGSAKVVTTTLGTPRSCIYKLTGVLYEPTPATLNISDGPTYNFESRALFATYDHTLTITNSGHLAADIGSSTLNQGAGLAAPFTFAGGSYPGASGTCTITIAPEEACTIVIRYSPVTAGAHSDTLILDYSDSFGPKSAERALQGVGVATAVLEISDGPTYVYSPVAVGSSFTKSFAITNTGDGDATMISGAALAAGYSYTGGFPGTGGTCGATLAAGDTCTFSVTFTPTSMTVFNGIIVINFDDGITAQTADRPIVGGGS